MPSLRRIQRAILLYRILFKDKRTPWIAKVLPWLSLVYILWPLDLIPDFIPILGQLDDVLSVPLLFLLAIWLVPKNVRQDARRKVVDVEAVE